MTEPRPPVSVEADDALADVLLRLRGDAVGGRPVSLTIPAGSSLFLTAVEFRALKDAVERERFDLTVRTADPLRLQLARMLGLATKVDEAPPAPRPTAPSRPPGPPPVTAVIPSAPPPLRARAAEPSVVPARNVPPSQSSPTPARPGEDAAALPTRLDAPRVATVPAPANAPTAAPAGPVAAVAEAPVAVVAEPVAPVEPAAASRLRREPSGYGPLVLPPSLSPERTVAPPPTADPPAPGSDLETSAAVAAAATTTEERPPLASPWSRLRRVSPRSLPVLLGAGLVAVALVVAGVVFLLPRAEVAVVLKRAPLSAELVFDVAVDGAAPRAGAALAVSAAPATVEVAFEGEIPTTGTRSEPDQPATGVVRLRNQTGDEITVEAGTTVATEDGVEFVFAEDVAVPTGEPFGEAEGTVRAVRPGTGGNVEPGAIGGLLPSGVYYSNRDGPTAGGTERSIRTVAAADLETLRAQAENAVPALARAAFRNELPAGSAVLPSSFEIGAGTDAFNHDVGDDAETVRLRAERPVTALAYEANELLARADDELTDQLAAQAPDGYAVAADSVAIAEPVAIEEREDGGRYRLTAQAEARATLDDAERRALAEELAGEDPAAAAAILGDVPEIERFTIAYRPGWLPDRMPANAGRIEVEPGD